MRTPQQVRCCPSTRIPLPSHAESRRIAGCGEPNGRRSQTMSDLQRVRCTRVGRIARSRCRLRTIVSGCVLVAAFGAAADPGAGEVEKLLAEAVRASSDGDFETAWTSHRRAWQIAVASREAGDAMQGFCERHDCPRIRKTAWLLGKPSSELGFLARDCRGRESESDACGRWFDGLHRVRAHLGPDRRAPGHPPQEWEMRFFHLASGDLRPWTVVAVGGKLVWAILDTGAPHAVIGRGWADLAGGRAWICHRGADVRCRLR